MKNIKKLKEKRKKRPQTVGEEIANAISHGGHGNIWCRRISSSNPKIYEWG